MPASDVNSDGTFNFTFQDFTDSSGNPVNNGTFTVSVTATYTNVPNHVGPSPSSNVVTFEIDNTTPASVTDFRLNPADDTGVSGDDVTTDRSPYFIGTTTPGYTVELFVNGQTAVQSTAVAGTTQTDANGKTYNFSIQLPFNLNDGETSVYVEVIDPAGNVSSPSNSVGVAITSTEVDYNGGPTSDPALFARNTTSHQLQWLVQTPAASAARAVVRRPSAGVALFAAFVFTGTLTSGSAVRHGRQQHASRPGRRPGRHRHRHPGRDDHPGHQQHRPRSRSRPRRRPAAPRASPPPPRPTSSRSRATSTATA